MTCITINDIELLNVLLTTITLILACIGISTWKKQLKGTFAFTKKKELCLELRKFKYQYNNIISEIEAFLDIYSDKMQKQVLQSVIGESLKTQLDTSNRTIETIRLLLLEVSPLDKKHEQLWKFLNLNIFTFHFFHEVLANEIEDETISSVEIMDKLREFLELIKNKTIVTNLEECIALLSKN